MIGCVVLLLCALPIAARADDGAAPDGTAADASAPNTGAPDSTSRLVRTANSPLSDILQFRLQDTYIPEFHRLDGDSNTLTLAITAPLPKYRLIPFPQLSLLTIPTVTSVPGDQTGLGDLRFVDIAVLDPGRHLLFGVGPTFVFPSATTRSTGQGKWQAGPAAAVAFAPPGWLVGLLAQNPISFGGDPHRLGTNALFLQPFVTYQLGSGWFIRSQPQIAVDWKSHGYVVPLDLGAGRLFRIRRQYVNVFVEPFWTVARRGAAAPLWGVTVGAALLYPRFWSGDVPSLTSPRGS
jgi:hypothetical protein